MHPSEMRSVGCSESMSLGWYAVYTRHQHEKSAADWLSRKGFEVLLPLYHSENRWSDRKKVVSLPLFPNYLFVEADLERRLDVLRSPGVCWFVGNSSGPAAITPDQIETVRKLAEFPTQVEPHPYLECGTDVRVRKGPLAGLSGVLVRIKNKQRVVISLTLLQKAAAVEVDGSNLERLRPSLQLPNKADSQPLSIARGNLGAPNTRADAEYGSKSYYRR